MIPQPKIRNFITADLAAINHLQPKDWNAIQTEFLQYSLLPYCFPFKVVKGQHIIGLGNAILHEESAWLSHIIVDETERGKGIGQMIVQHLLEFIQKKNIASICLIATDLGSPVYEKFGFKTVSNYAFFQRNQSMIQTSISPLIYSGIKRKKSILALDQEITGERREKLILGHLDRCLVYEKEGKLEGYYLPYLGQGAIYAKTNEAGIALMDLKYNIDDKAALPIENNSAIDYLVKRGFTSVAYTAKRMILGKDISWKPNHIFNRIGGNYG
ncbi:GNAT family N-acetyltransferase [Sphingobacterium sp. LRF_L2]|uniref:GNAT family N-acetyltransferase n=1 Tax=Sphingobacterium sp. LRF_L2 TaxID=3369421 RepID=UPI003F5DB466